MTLRMKPLPARPELEKKLKESVEAMKKLSPKEREELLKKQAESWARQDKD